MHPLNSYPQPTPPTASPRMHMTRRQWHELHQRARDAEAETFEPSFLSEDDGMVEFELADQVYWAKLEPDDDRPEAMGDADVVDDETGEAYPVCFVPRAKHAVESMLDEMVIRREARKRIRKQLFGLDPE